LSSRLIRNSVVLVVLAVFGLALLWTYFVDSGTQTPYTYTELLQAAAKGEVTSVVQDGTRLTVVLNGDKATPKEVVVPSDFVNVRQEICAAAGADNPGACPVDYSAVEASAAGASGTRSPLQRFAISAASPLSRWRSPYGPAKSRQVAGSPRHPISRPAGPRRGERRL